jgi:hypothetical protein
MKNLKGFLATFGLLAVSINAYTLDPAPGPYAGVILGGSYLTSVNLQNLNPVFSNLYATNTTFSNYMNSIGATINGNSKYTLSYSFMGLLGAQVGYRFDNFRMELEGFYDTNPVNYVAINSVQLSSGSSSSTKPVYVSGQTNIAAGLINFFYDFIPPGNIDTSVSPYVGLGVGYGWVQNNLNLQIGGKLVNQGTLAQTKGAVAGQIIVGLAYFIDDYSYFGFDARLFSTVGIQQPYPYNNNENTNNYTLASANLSFNGHFDLG